MKASLSCQAFLSGLTLSQVSSITKVLTLPNRWFHEASRAGRTTRGIPPTIELFARTRDGLAIPRGIDPRTLPGGPWDAITIRNGRRCARLKSAPIIALRAFG